MGGSSRRQTVGFRYRMGVLFGVCYGPVDRVVRLLVGEREAWRGAVTANGSANVSAPQLFGGDEKEGGIVGTAHVMMGGGAQTLPSAVSALLPSPAPAMRGILSILYNGQISANNPYVKPFAWQVTRILAGWAGGSAWNPTRAAIQISSTDGENDVLLVSGMEGASIVDESSWHHPLTVTNFAAAAPGLYGGYAARIASVGDGGSITTGGITSGLLAWTPDDDFTAEIVFSVSQPHNNNFNLVQVNASGEFAFRARVNVNTDGSAQLQCSLLTNALPNDVPLTLTYGPRHHVVLDYNGTTHVLTVYYDGAPLLVEPLDGAVPAYTWISSMTPVSVDSAFSDPWPLGWVRVDGWRFTRNRRRYTSSFVPPTEAPYDDGLAGLLIEAMNPAHIIYQCLTDTRWGMGYPTATIGSSFTAAAQTLFDEGLGLCMIWNQQEEIGAFVRQVLDHCGGVLYSDPKTGLFELKLLRGDYTAGSLPLYDPTNVVALEAFQRAGYGDTTNEVTVVYRDVATNKDAPITVHNLANIQAQGGTVASTKQYPGLPTAELAARVAQRDLIASSTPLAKCRLVVNREAWAEVPGGVIRLTWPKLGLSAVVFRVLGIDYGTMQDGRIKVELVEDVFGLPASSYVDVQPNTWVEPDMSPAPVAVAEMIEAPYLSLVAEMSAADLSFVDADSAYMAALAAEPNGAAQAFNLHARVGTAVLDEVAAGSFVPAAVVNGAITKTATTIPIESAQGLDAVQPDDLAVIGTGRQAEWVKVIAVDTVTPALLVARGVLDTTPKAHADGTRIFFDDGRAAFDPTERATGEVVDYALQTTTASGALDLSLAPIISITAQQRQHRPYPPGAFTINGASYPALANLVATVAWAHRDRLQQTADVIEQDEGNIGPEAGTTYTVEYRRADTNALLLSVTGISGTSYTLAAPLDGAFDLLVRLWAVRGGVDSWHVHEHTLFYVGTTVQSVVASLLPGSASATSNGTAAGVTLTVEASVNNGNDPNNAQVVLRMHADGTDGSTTFTDTSLSAHALTAVGNAQVDTAQSQWGGASALFDGTGDYISAAASTDFEFGSGDFTIEFWLRLTGTDNFGIFYTEDGNTSLHFDASRWVWRANNTNVFITTDTPALNTWFHIALVRNGTTTRVYRDGVMVATGTSVNCSNTNSAIRIGGGYQQLNGHIDDLRITKGVARYTAAGFSLPSGPFPDA